MPLPTRLLLRGTLSCLRGHRSVIRCCLKMEEQLGFSRNDGRVRYAYCSKAIVKGMWSCCSMSESLGQRIRRGPCYQYRQIIRRINWICLYRCYKVIRNQALGTPPPHSSTLDKQSPSKTPAAIHVFCSKTQVFNTSSASTSSRNQSITNTHVICFYYKHTFIHTHI